MRAGILKCLGCPKLYYRFDEARELLGVIYSISTARTATQVNSATAFNSYPH